MDTFGLVICAVAGFVIVAAVAFAVALGAHLGVQLAVRIGAGKARSRPRRDRSPQPLSVSPGVWHSTHARSQA